MQKKDTNKSEGTRVQTVIIYQNLHMKGVMHWVFTSMSFPPPAVAAYHPLEEKFHFRLESEVSTPVNR